MNTGEQVCMTLCSRSGKLELAGALSTVLCVFPNPVRKDYPR